MPDIFAGRVRVRASALIIQQQCLLLVRQNVPTRQDLVWLPPGGGVEPGEFSDTALRREVLEETGLEISGTRLKYIHEFVEPPYHAVELYYLAEQTKGEPETGTDPELDELSQQISEVKFVPLKELQNLNISPEFLAGEIRSGRIHDPEILHFKSS